MIMKRTGIKMYLTFLVLLISYKSESQTLTDSLISYYPFNGNANDITGNGNNGIVSGAVLTADRFGNPSSAYSFNGTSDYISYAVGTGFKPESFPISFSAWIKSNCSVADDRNIFRNDNSIDTYSGVMLLIGTGLGGVPILSYGNCGSTSSCCRRSKAGQTNVNDNQWHFIAGVFRGPTDMDIWVDCNYDGGTYSGNGGSLCYTNSNGGSSLYDVVSGTSYYKGAIDDIRFYHRELTQTDLQALYYYPTPYGNSPATVDLGNDSTFCNGATITLNPATTGTVQSYLWSTGATTSTINVNQSGNYWLQLFDGCGLTSDTVEVQLQTIQPIDLGNDTVLCKDQYLILDDGSAYDSYLWSNGATTQNIIVNATGFYSSTVTANGCISSDTIHASFVVCEGIYSITNKTVHANFDENSNCINIWCDEIFSSENNQLILFDAVGKKIIESDFTIEKNRAKIYLEKRLISGFYIASIKTQSSILNLPIVISH